MEGLIKINGFYINLSQVRAFATGKYTLVYMNDAEYKFEGEEAEALKLWLESQHPQDLMAVLATDKEFKALVANGYKEDDARMWANYPYIRDNYKAIDDYVAYRNSMSTYHSRKD